MQTYQDIILKLKSFWAANGAVIQEPFDVEVGAGTMCPETFLRVLGPKPYRVAYVQPSRRVVASQPRWRECDFSGVPRRVFRNSRPISNLTKVNFAWLTVALWFEEPGENCLRNHPC